MAGELVAALQDHSKSLTDLYRDLHKLTLDEIDDINQYQSYFDRATTLQTWFKARKRVANTMKAAAAKK